jgi:hypothetical protein
MRLGRPLASAPKLTTAAIDLFPFALAQWASRRKRQFANLPHPQGTAKSHQSPSSHGRYIVLENAGSYQEGKMAKSTRKMVQVHVPGS